jgi:hypothetical protein
VESGGSGGAGSGDLREETNPTMGIVYEENRPAMASGKLQLRSAARLENERGNNMNVEE